MKEIKNKDGSTCQKMKISNKKNLKLPILRKNLKKNKNDHKINQD